MIHRPSFCSMEGFYACAITLLINFPLDVSKPVERTNPMQHLFKGGRGIELILPSVEALRN